MKKSYHESTPRPHSLEEKIGDRIRQIREASGLSMRAVAALGGPSVSAQVLVEGGFVCANINTLKVLANILRVEMVEFFLSKDSVIEEVASLVYAMDEKQLAKLRAELERKVVN